MDETFTRNLLNIIMGEELADNETYKKYMRSAGMEYKKGKERFNKIRMEIEEKNTCKSKSKDYQKNQGKQ